MTPLSLHRARKLEPGATCIHVGTSAPWTVAHGRGAGPGRLLSPSGQCHTLEVDTAPLFAVPEQK